MLYYYYYWYYYYYYYHYYYCIDRHIYVNLSKSTQSATGLMNTLKPAANGQSMPIYIILLYIYPPVSEVHAGPFRVSVIHRTLTWTTRSLTCVGIPSWTFFCVRIYTGVRHTDSESAQPFWLGKTHTFFSCGSDGVPAANIGSSDLESGDVVAQLVERWPRDPMDSMVRGSNPVRSTSKNCEFFWVKMLCCLVVGVPHPRVYTHA